MKMKHIAASIALMGVGVPALAQSVSAPVRVEITGSSIKRIAAEGALPVEIIGRAEIERSGLTTAEQFVATLTAAGGGTDNLASLAGNAGQVDPSKPDTINNYGNSSANLRGLGAQNTLVLLNGRRISNHGLKGATVDLGAIPLGAIDRIEILRDGASAIYGTDAIGGVMNFILRRDYNGLEATAGTDITEEGGGNIHKASAVWGMGSLDKDRYNVMVALSASKNEILLPTDRDFARNGHIPEKGVAQETIGTPYATQTRLGAASALERAPASAAIRFSNANLLALKGECDSVPEMYRYADEVTGVGTRRWGCSYNYNGRAVLQQPFESKTLSSRLNLKLGDQHEAFVEYFASETDARKRFEPNQITSSLTAVIPGSQLTLGRFLYPAGGKYYQDLGALYPNLQAQTGMSFDNKQNISFRWRCLECGERIIDTNSTNQRSVLGLQGTIGAYDYKLGLLSGSSTAKSRLVGGYNYTAGLNDAIWSGNVNLWLLPGQSQDPAGQALIDASSANGIDHLNGKTTIRQYDGSISGDLFKLPAGSVSFAVGFEERRETYQMKVNPLVSSIWQAPSDSDFGKRSRDVNGLYAELLVPLVKNLEATIALRRDKYSDFGSTTNPKYSLRYQPLPNLLFRASANEGFRAPTFNQLYGGGVPDYNNLPILPSAEDDPSKDCNALTGAARDGYCDVQFQYATGANPFLKPETSKQWTIGMVFQPFDALTVGIDYWHIKRNDLITFLGPLEILDNYEQLQDLVVRNADGTINYIVSGRVNASGAIAKGADITATLRGKLGPGQWSATLTGSLLDSYKDRLLPTDPWQQRVGKWSSDALRLQWRHNLGFTYTQGPWSGTLAQSYIDGHDAYVTDTGVTQPGGKVDSYIRYNFSASYTGFKNTTINFGVRNLLNTDPPFSIHNSDEVSGTSWDPRVGDPRGRAYFINATYKFF